MDDDAREVLSEVLDDEADRFTTQRFVQTLLEDAKHKELWARYHLVSDVIGNRLTSALGGELLDRVRSAIDAEPPLVRGAPAGARLARPMAGVALAASVAAAAVLGARFLQPGSTVRQPFAAAPAAGVVLASNRWSATQPTVEARLNRYLVTHSEYAGYGVGGMMPYARIVGYDAGE